MKQLLIKPLCVPLHGHSHGDHEPGALPGELLRMQHLVGVEAVVEAVVEVVLD